MTITKEIINAIQELNKQLNKENSNIDQFTILLKEKSEELKIEYNTLLNLMIKKDFLHEIVHDQVQDIEKEIKQKEEELRQLKMEKYTLGHLICELHGHNYNWEAFEEMQICTNCGASHSKVMIGANEYLRKVEKQTSPLYKKERK